VTQHGVADDHVEAAVAEAQRPTIPLLEGGVVQPGRELAGLGDEHRRRVDADRFGHARPACQQPCDRTRPAADLQLLRARGELDLRKVGIEDRSLLGSAARSSRMAASRSWVATSTSAIAA
jgi:hypothetical protein